MYFLTEKRICVEGREYTVYGMKYNDGLCVEDISADKAAVHSLVKKCNEYQLEPIHMLDVIDDFLARV